MLRKTLSLLLLLVVFVPSCDGTWFKPGDLLDTQATQNGRFTPTIFKTTILNRTRNDQSKKTCNSNTTTELQIGNKLNKLFIWFKFLLRHPFWYQDIIFWFYLGSYYPAPFVEEGSLLALLYYLVLLQPWGAIPSSVGCVWYVAGLSFRKLSPLMFETISSKVLVPAMIVTTIIQEIMYGYETILTPGTTSAAMDDKMQQEIRERNKRLGSSLAEIYTRIGLRSVAWYLLSTIGLMPSETQYAIILVSSYLFLCLICFHVFFFPKIDEV